MSSSAGSAAGQFRRRAGAPKLAVVPAEQEEWVENYRAWSYIHWRVSPVWMLELRFLNGNRLALAYPYLSSVSYNAAGSIVLEFAGRVVTLEGFNLAELFEALREHRVGYVQELDRERDEPQSGAAFIHVIKVSVAGSAVPASALGAD